MIEICVSQALVSYCQHRSGLVRSSLLSDRKYSEKIVVNHVSFFFAISYIQTIPLALMKLWSVIENRNQPSAIET